MDDEEIQHNRELFCDLFDAVLMKVSVGGTIFTKLDGSGSWICDDDLVAQSLEREENLLKPASDPGKDNLW